MRETEARQVIQAVLDTGTQRAGQNHTCGGDAEAGNWRPQTWPILEHYAQGALGEDDRRRVFNAED
jgi:hypothetical protein